MSQLYAQPMQKNPARTSSPAPGKAPFWQRRQRELTFLVLFLLILGGGFTVVSLTWADECVVEPFTAGLARASGAALKLLGQEVTMHGTVIRGPRFAVNIRNGCNGLEATLIFVAAVLAFPAVWRRRLIGLALGVLALQIVNLVRVVALFLTGVYLPRIFDSSHAVIWQTIVILLAVLLWILWASRLSTRTEPAEPNR